MLVDHAPTSRSPVTRSRLVLAVGITLCIALLLSSLSSTPHQPWSKLQYLTGNVADGGLVPPPIPTPVPLESELEREPEGADSAPPPPPWVAPPSNVLDLQHDSWPVPAELHDSDRYLSYLPHSGYHNQRLALVNALVLAAMLNRTLLVPMVTFGDPVGWYHGSRLQHELDKAERSNLQACRAIQDHDERRAKCGTFWNSVRASWSWLIDAKGVSSEHRVITRASISRKWFQTTLNITESQTKTFEDADRYTHQIFDEESNPAKLSDFGANFTNRINLPELEALRDYKLLELGSLFSANRLVLSHYTNIQLQHRTERLMVFKEPHLNAASEAIVSRLGGFDSYVGLHLRVGASMDKFAQNARGRTAGVFKALCRKYGLPDSTVNSLLLQNRRHPDRPTYIPPLLPSPRPPMHPSPSLSCPSGLYPPSSPLAPLNTPLYVATDAHFPRKDELLELFRNTFPCIFFLGDFKETNSINDARVEPLGFMETSVDKQGEPLGRFLEPFVEAEVVAKAKIAVGTPGSTFSGFATTTLFQAYHSSDP